MLQETGTVLGESVRTRERDRVPSGDDVIAFILATDDLNMHPSQRKSEQENISLDFYHIACLPRRYLYPSTLRRLGREYKIYNRIRFRMTKRSY